MGRATIATAFAVLFLATAAGADTPGTISATLSPNSSKANSTLTVTATGPFPSTSGLPTSLDIQAQKGFMSSAKSVAVLCTTSQENTGSCAATSQIGTGTASATVNAPVVGTFSDTINFTLFLGVPQKKGDIASILLSGKDTFANQTLNAVGRLFARGDGGLEILFSSLPTINAPGITITLNSLQLTAGAQRTVTKIKKAKHKHGIKGKHKKKHKKHARRVKVTYSLITNPPTCAGAWTGNIKVTFQNGAVSQPLSIACVK